MKIKKENKCRLCNRYIPEHMRFIKCSDCSRFYHVKCSDTSIKSFQNLQQNNSKWTCNKCTLMYLPCTNIDDDNFKQTLNVLDLRQLKDQLDILPSFRIRTRKKERKQISLGQYIHQIYTAFCWLE